MSKSGADWQNGAVFRDFKPWNSYFSKMRRKIWRFLKNVVWYNICVNSTLTVLVKNYQSKFIKIYFEIYFIHYYAFLNHHDIIRAEERKNIQNIRGNSYAMVFIQWDLDTAFHVWSQTVSGKKWTEALGEGGQQEAQKAFWPQRPPGRRVAEKQKEPR